MFKHFYAFATLFAFVFVCLELTAQPTIKHLSTFATGEFGKGAAEIAAYDPATRRVFFTNASKNSIDVLDISKIEKPTMVKRIDISGFRGEINSVACNNGIVAAAITNEDKTQTGIIALFNTAGDYVVSYPAGALPDMVTFSPDGKFILCANEGEPDDDYVIDPEGSVTLVDISAGATAGVVKQIDFKRYNTEKMSLKNRGIRIYGPNATVAQDLEPEYIAVSEDNLTAYVSCQENNAIAVIDLKTGTLVDLVPMGYKDHWKGQPDVVQYAVNKAPGFPDLGIPASGGPAVKLGGFSGLWYDASSSTASQLSFYTVPDRGPNEEAIAQASVGSPQDLRPYKLPDYQGRIVKINLVGGQVYIDANPIMLTRKDGVTPITGLGNIPGYDEVPVTRTDAVRYPNKDFTFGGASYHQLPYDPYGGDFEGIVKAPNGDFWMCDENRPSIYHFGPTGVLIERYVPKGAASLGTNPQPVGTYGAETLPEAYNKRRGNRGFEAIALDAEEGILYAFIQSPIENPGSSVRNRTDVIRILGIDPANGQPVREYVYLLENNRLGGLRNDRIDKIGDAVYLGNGRFAVLERDSGLPSSGKTSKHYLFEIDMRVATNILGTPLSNKTTSANASDKTLEMMTADDLAAAGIRPVHKRKVANLPSIGYHPTDKPEGLTVTPQGEIFVINDNDFGVAGAGVLDDISLGRIAFKYNYGFDASDRNASIAINPRPTMGMYQPDAIAAAQIGGKGFVFTANEGDARDYDGFSEDARVKDLKLDKKAYPSGSELQKDYSLGRLKTSSAEGDWDGDGDVDQIYSYGGRSFSILDDKGNLIYDSGADFEIFTFVNLPQHFNSEGDGKKQTRSDDKGPEPEAVTITEWQGQHYALIALERIGGFMTYNVTDPYKPYFVGYTYNRDYSIEAAKDSTGDIAPEAIFVIKAADSPNGQPVVVTSSEVSGTVSFFSFGAPAAAFRSEDENLPLQQQLLSSVYPNPLAENSQLRLHLPEPGSVQIQVSDITGRVLNTGNYESLPKGLQSLPLAWASGLVPGTYFVSVRFKDTLQVHKTVKH